MVTQILPRISPPTSALQTTTRHQVLTRARWALKQHRAWPVALEVLPRALSDSRVHLGPEQREEQAVLQRAFHVLVTWVSKCDALARYTLTLI